MTFDPELMRARWYMGMLRPEDLPRAARDALEAGFDGPALRRIAGLDKPHWQEVERSLPTAFQEMGLSGAISRADAGLTVTKDIAARIASGDVAPYEGARAIWWQVYLEIGEPEQLVSFVGLASEYEDHPELRDELSHDIVMAAEEFLRLSSAHSDGR